MTQIKQFTTIIYRLSLVFLILAINGCTGGNSIESLFAPNSELESSDSGETKNVTSDRNDTMKNKTSYRQIFLKIYQFMSLRN